MENIKSGRTVRFGSVPETELLADCKVGGVGCVVAQDMAAVSKSASGFMDFLGKLRSCGVALRLEKEGLCLKP